MAVLPPCSGSLFLSIQKELGRWHYSLLIAYITNKREFQFQFIERIECWQ
uniref:Uncharacterized protein n=1 Tax=Nelumbo nucifera TaxID=4432 RepID=A0A822YLB2_NELNU|nr:TPA_asm: hypothetical protein HUJ06_012148 [Nelumbo nucifera]